MEVSIEVVIIVKSRTVEYGEVLGRRQRTPGDSTEDVA